MNNIANITSLKLSVIGLGMVSRIGDAEDLEQLLTKNSSIITNELPSNHSLPIDIPDDFQLAQQLPRRMSHFAKISLVSACRAVRDSGLDISGKQVGIIQGSVYGPIISGIQAFDDLIDFGDNQLSPTNFSGSVFNTSATYLSLAFGIQGPTLSHTSGMDTLFNSLLSASLWLETGTVDYVLMGVGDEYTTYFDNGFTETSQLTGLLPTCEGWTTFILSKQTNENTRYGEIRCRRLHDLPQTKFQKNIYSVWHELIKSDLFSSHAQQNQPCFAAHMRGSYPSASAFDLTLALICAKKGRFPVYDDSEHNYRIQDLHRDEGIRCFSIAENNDIYCYEVCKD